MKILGIIMFALLLFCSCGEEKEEQLANVKPPSKTSHFYFDNYVLRSFKDSNADITIKIPECFEKDEYGSYGPREKWMLKCTDNYSFLSIDYFTEKEIDNYFYYYAEEEEEMGNHLDYLLKFIVASRTTNLVDPEVSQRTTAKNERNLDFVFQSVRGRESDYQDELFFMFGAVELDGQYFIIQSICSFDNIKFLLADFKEMMFSLKSV